MTERKKYIEPAVLGIFLASEQIIHPSSKDIVLKMVATCSATMGEAYSNTSPESSTKPIYFFVTQYWKQVFNLEGNLIGRVIKRVQQEKKGSNIKRQQRLSSTDTLSEEIYLIKTS